MGSGSLPRSARVAGAVLVAAPLGQLVLERSVSLPVGPARMAVIAVMLLALVPLARLGFERAAGVRLGRGARGLLAAIVPALALTHLLACARLADGPFGPVPGGPLQGPVAQEAAPDWSVAADARYAELEVAPARPRSLETLLLVHAGDLYVAANLPEDKRWPAEVRADGRVRIPTAAGLHERRAHRIDAPGTKATLLAAMNAKYGFDVSLGGEIWFFRLDPR